MAWTETTLSSLQVFLGLLVLVEVASVAGAVAAVAAVAGPQATVVRAKENPGVIGPKEHQNDEAPETQKRSPQCCL